MKFRILRMKNKITSENEDMVLSDCEFCKMDQVTKLLMESDIVKDKIYGNLKGKKWCCLGDSLTTIMFNPNNNTNMYNIVANRYGINAINYGIVSSTINAGNHSNNPMCVRYADMDDDADIITVMGCTNDMYAEIGTFNDSTSDTLYGAMHVLCKGLKEKYPDINKTRIGFILPCRRAMDVGNSNWENEVNQHIEKCNVVKEVAQFYSIPVLDLCNESGFSALDENEVNTYLDGDHLNWSALLHKKCSVLLDVFIRNMFDLF